MKYLWILVGVCVYTATYGQHRQPSAAKKDFITSLKSYAGNDTIFRSPKGNLFKLSFITDDEVHAEALAANCSTNTFGGTDRKACKISIAVAPVQTKNFAAFMAVLPDDATMRANPGITTSPNNKRVAEENHNYKITGIFLFAIKRESDNDYHLIIGNKKDSFFNVEISGLPPVSSAGFQKMSKARAVVDAFFGGVRCNTGGYELFPEGIKIQLTGSAFYDIDHKPGTVGPDGFRPKTAWEIHPITDIKFLQ